MVIRNGRFPLDRPPPQTALLVWPYLTWRAYNAYDADLDGRPDSWYQFWPQRRVSLVGALLPGGVEDDYEAARPFSRWLCPRRGPRGQSVTDVELGRLRLSTLNLRTDDEIYTGRGATQEDGRLLVLLTSGGKEMRMTGTLAKLKDLATRAGQWLGLAEPSALHTAAITGDRFDQMTWADTWNQAGAVRDPNFKLQVCCNIANDYWALHDNDRANAVYEDNVGTFSALDDFNRQAGRFGVVIALRHQ